MAGRIAASTGGLCAAALLALLAPACAQASGQGSSHAGSQASSKPDAAAQAADPAQLIDPDMFATAIEVRETTHFASITITPVDSSENSRALIRNVLQDQQGMEDLHAAIRGNRELMKTLKGKGIPVDDVVSVTTDRNDNAIVFTRG